MRHGVWRWFALISILILTFLPCRAGKRPSYGGNLRFCTSGQLTSLAPAFAPVNGPEAALRLRLLPLVFEGLVRLNERGLPEAVLAASWTSSADFRRWNFSVRPGARFHDGSPVTASALVDCLTTVENPFIVFEYEGRVVIESADPMPDLLRDLAMPERAVSKTSPDGASLGTGPFQIKQWEPGQRGVLAAFDSHWAGRPFVDQVVIQMGQAPRNQWMDLELGRVDLIEVPLEEVRTTLQRGYRILTSRPLELMTLAFSSPASSSQDLDLRRALALAIDREAILRVLLQRQGEAARSLLPGWISGYAFLFGGERDVSRARSLLPPLGREPELTLGYPASDRLARSICERLALDVGAAGIRLHPVAVQEDAGDWSAPSIKLLRIPIGTVDERRALISLASSLELPLPKETNWSQPESAFKVERKLLEDLRLIPLFHLPFCYAAGPRVRYLRPEDVYFTQTLHLENLWVENAGSVSGGNWHDGAPLLWPDSRESGAGHTRARPQSGRAPDSRESGHNKLPHSEGKPYTTHEEAP